MINKETNYEFISQIDKSESLCDVKPNRQSRLGNIKMSLSKVKYCFHDLYILK